ncbi:protein FAM136A [Passer montanus]|uniref:protein FAM136A n=1 Tax=Passer montanus TaxID=9160 RepID=UPI00195F994E|nr:protein FAM136A [Passer montanus]
MAEAAQGRVQAAVESAVQGLEREQIRGMQGAMFRCSARCCEDAAASMQEVQRCIERCHAPLARAQAIVTAELEHFQVNGAPAPPGTAPGPWAGWEPPVPAPPSAFPVPPTALVISIPGALGVMGSLGGLWGW